VMLFIT